MTSMIAHRNIPLSMSFGAPETAGGGWLTVPPGVSGLTVVLRLEVLLSGVFVYGVVQIPLHFISLSEVKQSHVVYVAS